MKTRYFVALGKFVDAVGKFVELSLFWRKIGDKIEFMDDSNGWQPTRLTLKDLKGLKEITLEEMVLMM